MTNRTRIHHKPKPIAPAAVAEQPAADARDRLRDGKRPATPGLGYGYDFSTVRVGEAAATSPNLGLPVLRAVQGAGVIQRQEADEAAAPAASPEQQQAGYDKAVQAADWQQVAVSLIDFNDAAIGRLLRRLRKEQGTDSVRAVYAAVLQSMPSDAERIYKPIERLLHINSATGYVGLNPKAGVEAKALKRQAPGQVIVSLDNSAAEAALGTPEGKKAEVQGLGLAEGSKPYQDALACLEQCDSQFVEQMADLLRMFRNAELGKYRLERLVLSGHHAGGAMWGTSDTHHSPGELQPGRDIQNLAAAFPIAAVQVQDVMLSACNSTNEVDGLQKAFPNLQSIWVYRGYSPSVDQGSAGHIQHWERTTRGERKPHHSDEVGNSAVWTRQDGMLVEI